MSEKLILIDGNSLLHRAFHAIPLLTNSQGQYTNGVYGFTNMLLKLIGDEHPDYLLVAFDKGKKTFRHQMYKEYKGTRKPTAPELSGQFGMLRDVLASMGIPYVEMDDYEADDLIGTFSRKGQDEGLDVLIVSGDKDTLQLISDRVRVLLTRKGISQTELCDRDWLEQQYGLTPGQMIDLKALMGDSSDNIPGVPGVGEKTALKLIHQYQTLEKVYDHLEDIGGKRLPENLKNHRDDAFLSYELGRINVDIPLEQSPRDYVFRGIHPDGSREIFQELGFRTLLKQLPGAPSGEPDQPESAGSEERPKPDEPVNSVRLDEASAFAQQLREQGDKPAGVALSFRGEGRDRTIEEIALATGAGIWVYSSFMGSAAESADLVQQLLSNRAAPLYCHEGKELTTLALQEEQPAAPIRDTRIMAHLLASEDRVYDLEEILATYGELQVDCSTTAGRARGVFLAGPLVEDQMKADGLWELYEDLELPLLNILCRMELHGIRVDPEILEEMSRDLTGRIGAYEKEIHQLAGEPFNINSPKQLAEVLFERLGLKPLKKTKTGFSTNAEVLEKLRGEHPVIGLILEYRQLVKLKNTYVEGLIQLAHEGDGIVHTTYQQTATATGRLSSTDPNLQNIPIRTEEGKKIRRAFKPVSEDHQLMAADYSQIELRIFAHLADDQKMIEAFASGEDFHTLTASEVFGVDPADVDSEMRRRAKAVNFGIVYGISDYGLARDLNIPVKEAGEYIERYFNRFPEVKRYIDNTVQTARDTGMVTTMLNRRRKIENIGSRNFNLRSAAERMAMNTPIQGSAADIIKLAMLRVEKRLTAENLQARMVLQVHDEIILEFSPGAQDQVARVLKEEMEGAVQLKVPLQVDIQVGPTWFDMEPVNHA